MKEKKPDHIVFDEETQTYNASVLPYATSVGAPKIEVEDLSAWKKHGVHKVNKKIASKFEELRAAYLEMVSQYEYNDLVYNASFSFEPVIGEVYYLYLGKKENYFLSLIAPSECSWDFQGAFRLNSEKVWEKVNLK